MNSGNGNIIRKHNKEKDFTIIDNNIFKNKHLTLKAKGLLCLMLSLQDGWEFSNSGLSKLSKDGIDSVKSGLDELEEHGYLIRETTRNKGKFGNTIFNLFEKPYRSGKNRSGKTVAEKPSTENPHNKELINKELNNKVLSNKTLVCFDDFWKLYPNKKNQSKKNTKEAFRVHVKTEETYNLILKDLERRKKFEGWIKEEGKYIPHATTYIRGHRWEDEYDITENKEVINLDMDKFK